MRFHLSRIFVVAVGLIASSLVVVAPANAATGTCTVHNVTQDKSYGPNNGQALAAALEYARQDDLQVAGTCVGDYLPRIAHGILTIEGAADGSTVITAPSGATHALLIPRIDNVRLKNLTFTCSAECEWVIYNFGHLRLHRVSVVDSNPTAAAIESTGRVRIVSSLIARNTMSVSAAIKNDKGGWLVVRHSHVLRNVSAGPVGGILTLGYWKLVDSVVAHNLPTNCVGLIC